MIWPVFVIDLAFNVVKNLSKNRRLSWIGVSLTVVASAIVVIVPEVELDSLDSTSTTVANQSPIELRRLQLYGNLA